MGSHAGSVLGALCRLGLVAAGLPFRHLSFAFVSSVWVLEVSTREFRTGAGITCSLPLSVFINRGSQGCQGRGKRRTAQYPADAA